MGGVKNILGSNIYYYITTIPYFISLETTNIQKSEMFLLRISSGDLIPSVVTCQYTQIYNFSVRKEFLETLCKCIYPGFQILEHLL